MVKSALKKPPKSALKKKKPPPMTDLTVSQRWMQEESELEDVNNTTGTAGMSDMSMVKNTDRANQSHSHGVSGRSRAGDEDEDGQASVQSAQDIFGFSKLAFLMASCSRYLFLFTLLLATAGLASAVYLILDQAQVDAFEQEFETLATDLLASTNLQLQHSLQILQGVATTMTAALLLAQDGSTTSNGFVTLPHVEDQYGPAREATGASALAYLPLVTSDTQTIWQDYSEANQAWIAESLDDGNAVVDPILGFIWDDVTPIEEQDECPIPDADLIRQPSTNGPWTPLWTVSPVHSDSTPLLVNQDISNHANVQDGLATVTAIQQPLLLQVTCPLGIWLTGGSTSSDEENEDAESTLVYPVMDSFEDDDSSSVVGYMMQVIPWTILLQDIVPADTSPILVQLESSCELDETLWFQVHGPQVTQQFHNTGNNYQGPYGDVAITSPLGDQINTPDLIEQGVSSICLYTLTAYPTEEFEDEYESKRPLQLALVVVGVFVITVLLFFVFDVIMTRQRNKVMDTAQKQNAIVSSLFPKNIQAKMMQEQAAEQEQAAKLSKVGKAGIKSFLNDDELMADVGGKTKKKTMGAGPGGPMDKSKPIADLFPETTIMFGDIAGFTAWSSAREPSQVFTLLETIYHAFDMIAKKRRVFKVEVVGDCYVAVCGLPDPRKDHATAMAKFAMECVKEMNRLTQQLEVELGPDTADLRLRVGLHSGPVVAGVLRGEKSRFQLFGDTMNTASRMESTGKPNMVQISETTADLLEEAGKKHWFEPREEKVEAKGKGALNTFFLRMGTNEKKNNGSMNGSFHSSGLSTSDGASTDGGSLGTFRADDEMIEKRNRIADWTVEILAGLLREIQVRRVAAPGKPSTETQLRRLEGGSSFHENGDTVISEVAEIVELPKFDAVAAQRETQIDVDEVDLSEEVFEELRDFVRTIASMYHENPFHNFPHANHVTMSVVKLLSRIKAPDVADIEGTTLHDHTYGITSDPLTRFAVVLSALIHDVDHMGVPNAVLVKEGDPVADMYNDKSCAEQNSIDLAWDLLMEPRFFNLRRQIYTTEPEYKRFRQLVVNSVMATDIMDKDLKDLRNNRWNVAFAKDADQHSRTAINRKATIVIEHLIQASDVAHTMQHWHIYRKWNERLFQEMYKAYEEGRMENDPSENWYKGEIGFFDFYIIPLAKKLKDCGVFGVSSDEYLNYAKQNRKEWEARGEQICAEMIRNVKRRRVAQHVYQAAQDKVDLAGREIVADLSQSLRHQARQASNGSNNNKYAIDRAMERRAELREASSPPTNKNRGMVLDDSSRTGGEFALQLKK